MGESNALFSSLVSFYAVQDPSPGNGCAPPHAGSSCLKVFKEANPAQACYVNAEIRIYTS